MTLTLCLVPVCIQWMFECNHCHCPSCMQINIAMSGNISTDADHGAIYVCVCLWYMYMYIYIYIHIYLALSLSICIHTWIHMYIYIYIYIYKDTHGKDTHTHTDTHLCASLGEEVAYTSYTIKRSHQSCCMYLNDLHKKTTNLLVLNLLHPSWHSGLEMPKKKCTWERHLLCISKEKSEGLHCQLHSIPWHLAPNANDLGLAI